MIDAHVHIGRTEKIGRAWTFETYHQFASLHGIERVVAFPNISSHEPHGKLNNRFLSEWGQYHGRGFFVPFVLVDPRDGLTLSQLSWDRVRGAKFHPSISQVAADDLSMDAVWNLCAAGGKPAVVHCGRNTKSHIRHVISAAKRHPKVTFIAAHLGGNASDLIDEALGLLDMLPMVPNLWLDTSAVKLPHQIARAVEVVGFERVVFGSDEPYSDLRMSKKCLELACLAGQYEAAVKCGIASALPA